MPWTEVYAHEQKMRFVLDWLEGFFPLLELCRRYNISRPTGYRVIERFLLDGSDAFAERSRRPHNSPTRTPHEVEDSILNLREKRPNAGPTKLLVWLAKCFDNEHLPARSTICKILRRNGCVKKRRSRPRRSHPGRPDSVPEAPNDLWTADFKGQFRTGNGLYCYPLTVMDNFSRRLLCCQGMLSPTHKSTRAAFLRLFKQYGLPRRIRTDNGPPFATTALARLSRLSAWWIRLGIMRELIEPASPQQNGAHERMHRELKAETTRPPARNLAAQQRRFNEFMTYYNEERPHEAIGLQTPNALYHPSPRRLPDTLPQIQYPGHFEIRRVSTNCGIRMAHKRIRVSYCLAHDYVGLENVGDGLWDVYYGPLRLGRLDEREGMIEDDKGRLMRKSPPRRV